MTGGYRLDPGSRLALYERVVQTLERPADLAERHAEREQRDGRSNEAAYEWERARRARQLVARARAILRMTAELASSSAGSVSHAPWLTAPTVRVSPDRMSVSAVAEHACGGTVDNHDIQGRRTTDGPNGSRRYRPRERSRAREGGAAKDSG